MSDLAGSRPEAPVLAVGGIVVHDGAVLLVQRGRPPNEGQWAIPGGRVRLGERLAEAVERELLEETGIVVDAGELAYHFEYIERNEEGAVLFHYLVLDLLAEYRSGTPRGGDDARDARWVPFSELDTVALNQTTYRALCTLFPEQVKGAKSDG